MVRAGPFELEEPLAAGGMGQVWTGRHGASGTPVAVKVLTEARARRADAVSAFRLEARATAGLDHPGVVTVFDFGVVEDGGDAVPAGSPFLAMELGTGSLAASAGRRDWPAVKALLGELLAALAHAHARGVLHRDLKPANVLHFADTGRHKLADWGIAWAMSGSSPTALAGTPRYMAPEQFRRAWRDFGPWTDLYALGCTAWELVHGAPPFTGPLDALRQAHLLAPPPHAMPVMAVPPGLGAWLERLLQKAPEDRFRCAADASWALEQLGEPVMGAVGSGSAGGVDDSLTVLPGNATVDVDSLEPLLVELAPGPPPVRHASVPPPLPGSGVTASRSTLRLHGAGLGLYGLREVPLIDRAPQRDALWRALRGVAEGGGPAVVTLRGPAGNGKSRLARWLAERAHEVGAASVLTVRHGWPVGPRDGLAGAVIDRLRSAGLSRADTRRRAAALLGRDGPLVEDLLELLHPTGRGGVDTTAVWTRLLGAFAHERPLVLVVDDLQWGPGTLPVLQALLADGAPVLGVVTWQDGAPSVAVDLDDVEALGPSLAVPPLATADRRDLVEALLGLDRGLVDQIDARTAGTPLFAVQLVADWVERGVLVPAADGFALAPGAEVPLPNSLHRVCATRIDAALAGEPAASKTALVLAAVFGRDVLLDEWEAVCSRVGVAVPPLDLLARRQLVDLHAAGFRFDHGLLVESLRRSAGSDEPSLRAHAVEVLLAKADAIRARDPRTSHDCVARAEQLAQGLGDPLEARVRALRGVSWTARGYDERAVVDLEAALPRLGGLPLFEARIRVTLADALRGCRRLEASGEQVARALAILEPRGPSALLARALLAEGSVQFRLGDHAAAESAWLRGLAVATEAGARREQAAIYTNLGVLVSDQGRRAEAETHYRAGLAIAAGEFPALEGTLLTNLGICLFVLGRSREVAALFEHAVALHRRTGNRGEEATALGNLGLLAHAFGRLEESEQRFREALAIRRETGDRRAECRCLANLGAVLTVLDRTRARRVFERAAALAPHVGSPQEQVIIDGELGDLDRIEGRTAAAAVGLRRAADRAAAIGADQARAMFEAACRAVGAPSTLEPDAILAMARAGERPGLVCRSLVYLTLAAVREGDRAAASSHLGEAERMLARLQYAPRSQLGQLVEQARAAAGPGSEAG